MNAIRALLRQLLRGKRAGKLLCAMGVQPRRFWLLMDLFAELSDRGEMLDQLGRNFGALKAVVWMYAALSAFMTLGLMMTRPQPGTYLAAFLMVTAFLLLTVLLSEAGNSLINPVEAVVLAHQPINGATYTAAKLSHLLRIVLYMVAALNGVPALAGSFLKGAGWGYPLLHLAAALAVGLAAGLVSCAAFGWLMRFVPARRLKNAGQLAAVVPFLGMIWMGSLPKWLERTHAERWLPVEPAGRWALGAACGAAVLCGVALGIRSLSADYLVRVSGIMRGSAAGARTRRSWTGGMVARYFGGQAGRAGAAFVSRLMLRDWQFRRQMIPMAVLAAVNLVPLAARGWKINPFSGRFTTAHLVPHVIGIALFIICHLLPYGADYKGAWVFLLAPSRIFGRFAQGIHGLLFLELVAVPHAVLLPLVAWSWGVWHAGLFTLYSVAAASIYLALDLRLIEGVPFSKPMDASRGAMMLPLMMGGALAIAVAVGAQYFLIFRSPATVAAATGVLGAAAYMLTPRSVGHFEAAMRYNLGLLAVETKGIYTEVEG